MFSVAKQTFAAALLPAYLNARSTYRCSELRWPRRRSSLHYLRRSFTTNATEKRREEKGDARSDGLWWRSSPRAALTDACWEAKWAKRSARMPPPPKADAALSWEFVSDTDQTHYI